MDVFVLIFCAMLSLYVFRVLSQLEYTIKTYYFHTVQYTPYF